ncbi:MAG: glycosyltransferase family 4 protein [Bacteroidota bacterium]
MIITKIIHKLLAKKRKITIKGGNSKNALVSYVLFPPAPFNFNFFFNVSHNRYLKCSLMCEALKREGFTVYLYDYLNVDVDYTIKYDIFIGHNKTFSTISSNLDPTCKKVLLTTGSSPFYDNSILKKRQKQLQSLLHTNDEYFVPMQDIAYASENIEVADAFFMIGNKFISDTWNIPDHKHITYFSNVNNINFRKKKGRTNNFIYLSSVGQLRRGLDLILTVFKNRSEQIYICGDYEEPLFYKFKHNIENSPNIHLMGYVDQTSNAFKKMIADADFAILPSCSEGQSGSILTLMSYGLIPVITQSVGFSDVEVDGILIEDYTVDAVQNAVERCVNMEEGELSEKRNNLLLRQSEHTQQKFIETFTKMIGAL